MQNLLGLSPYVSICVCVCVLYICVCVQSPLVLYASYPNTTHRIPDIPGGRNYSTHQPAHGIWWPNDQDKVRHQNKHTHTHQEDPRTPCTLCRADEHVHVITEEKKRKKHIVCTVNVHTEPTEQKRSRCTKNSRSRLV